MSSKGKARWLVLLCQVLFVLIALPQLDQPLRTAHFERQNQTFDIARHVFREGWPAVITPTASFTVPGREAERSTAILQEVPLHGLLGWPFVKLFNHPYAVTRLVSIFFALLSISVLFNLLLHWVSPSVATLGIALWTFSPLVLQFGQVPMPDIICTTGILAALLFALRARLPASSLCFLFALLAKSNIIVFGLPVLVALCLSKNCRSLKDILRLAILWGWLPLLGLVAWMLAMAHFAPHAAWTTFHTVSDGRGEWITLLQLHYYLFLLGCAAPFGLGVLGLLGFGFCLLKPPASMVRSLKWSFYLSILVYLMFIVRKITEPQYFLPLLAWAIIAAAIGWQWAIDRVGKIPAFRVLCVAATLLHLLVAFMFMLDLKASRVPNFADIQALAPRFKPSDRILVLYRYYGASPAVWFDCNVLCVWDLDHLERYQPDLKSWDFDYVMLLDVSTRHSAHVNGFQMLKDNLRSLFAKPTETTVGISEYTDPASDYLKFCDEHFHRLFTGPSLVLYSSEK